MPQPPQDAPGSPTGRNGPGVDGSRERRAAGRPRLGEEDKAATDAELAAILDFLARKAVAEKRRGVTGGPRARDLLLVELLALTGLRASELARLELRDLVLAGRRSYLRVRGGKKRHRRHVDTVPIPWVLVDRLEAWRAGRVELRPHRKTDDGFRPRTLFSSWWMTGREPVFCAATSPRPMTRGEVWLAFKRAVRACGLRSVLTVHSLRHYYVSQIAKRSRSSSTVAKLARLRSPRLVDLYTHLALDERAELVGPMRLPGRRRSTLPGRR